MKTDPSFKELHLQNKIEALEGRIEQAINEQKEMKAKTDSLEMKLNEKAEDKYLRRAEDGLSDLDAEVSDLTKTVKTLKESMVTVLEAPVGALDKMEEIEKEMEKMNKDVEEKLKRAADRMIPEKPEEENKGDIGFDEIFKKNGDQNKRILVEGRVYHLRENLKMTRYNGGIITAVEDIVVFLGPAGSKPGPNFAGKLMNNLIAPYIFFEMDVRGRTTY